MSEVKNNNTVEEQCALCEFNCPVHTNVRKYVEFISLGKYFEAYQVIREFNPFPSVCALVCPHPCETECRRKDVEEPIAIRDLKRFAIERAEYGKKFDTKAISSKNKKIAIIGAGPSGLTAAYSLAQQGYSITVYDKLNQPGGLLYYAIPKYRLPKEILNKDIEIVKSIGVEIKTGVEIGKDIKFNELKSMGYNAILISAGLSVSRSLKIHGIENSGVLHALQFLQDINSGKSPNLGKKIIVIGGGNVAVDVARSVRRLGIDDVTMACLESRKEMPAWEWEINEAQEEGIKILPSRGPKQILGKDGKVSGYEMVEVKSVFDEQKRFNPSFYEDRISSIEADTIIVAIGQSADLSFLKDSNIKLNERGQILVDKNTLATSESGVFVSGEIAAGPGNAVDAVASGQRVAKIIDAYLKGEDLSKIAVFSRTKIDKLPKDISEKIRKIPRAKMPIELASKRINTFNIFELGFSEKDALVEARRCLSCGAGAVVDSDKCALCLTCVRICPYETPSAIKNTAQVQIEKCQACGLCSTECPAGAISLRGWDADLITNEIKNALADLNSGTSKTLILACSYHVNNWSEYDNINNNTNSKLLWLICTNKLSELEMLKAFENGADKLVIITCPEGECRYNSGGQWIQKKVGRVKKFLNELGIGEDKIAVYPYSKEIKEKWSEIIK